MTQAAAPSSRLPGPLLEAVRRTAVPPALRALFAQLPRPVHLVATLPAEADAVPKAARQLLRLALVTPTLFIESVTVGSPSLSVRGEKGERTLDLSKSVVELAHEILSQVAAPDDLAAALWAFSSQAAKKDALQKLTRSMLESRDLDRALYVLLTGVTSGLALGFNRAALFLFDEGRGTFVGSKAIGPADDAEAHRIWEEIEYEDKSIEDLFHDQTAEGRFQAFVRSVELVPQSGDEVDQASRASGPMLFRGAPRNPGLRKLEVGPEHLVAVIRPRGETMGLVVCDNFYSKDEITPDEVQALAFFLDQMTLVWENVSLLRRVETLARYDALTGVFNRRAFDTRFGEEQSRASRSRTPMSLLIIDVDHFKALNDTRGHAAGDDALRALGVALRLALRTHDVVGRVGGDEFAVILPDTSREHAQQVAARVGQLAAAKNVPLSIGGATWPDDCPEPSSLFATADANLYAAKRAGRARASFGRGEFTRYESSSSGSGGAEGSGG